MTLNDQHNKPSPYDIEAVHKWIEEKRKKPVSDKAMTKEETRQMIYEEIKHLLGRGD
jgi:hypothetical protein